VTDIPSAEALGIVFDSLPEVEAVIVDAHHGECQFGWNRGLRWRWGGCLCVRSSNQWSDRAGR